MVIYYLIAASTTFIAYLSCVSWRRSRMMGVLLLALVVFIFCHFAGARDSSIGTDTLLYGVLSYERAVNMTFLSFMNASWYQAWGVLMKAVMWCTANLFRSSYWYFFVIQLVTVVPVIVAVRRQAAEWLPLGVMAYALVFYPQSFNLMRQFASMGFVLLSFEFARNRRPVWFVACVLVGAGFHNAALIGLGVLPVVVYGRDGHFSGGLKTIAAGIVAIVVLCFSPQLLEWFTSLTGFYRVYISGEAVSVSASVLSVMEFVLEILFLEVIGALFLYKRTVKESTRQLSLLVLLSAALCFLSLISKWLYRISLFYMYFAILLIPNVAGQIEDKLTRNAFIVIVMVALAFFAFVYFGYQGQNEVVPYVFETVYLH